MNRRPPREPVDPWKPAAIFLEEERAEDGRVVAGAVVFLTNRECPWRCLMCDLWKRTLTESVPSGAISSQVEFALSQLDSGRATIGKLHPKAPDSHVENTPGLLEPIHQIKLYNSGSFFDPRAIPPEEDVVLAGKLRRFERVIVECHPAFLGDRVRRFRDLLGAAGRGPQLEVAMGLETAHPEVLRKLNKGMTLNQFRRAAKGLRAEGMAVRAFILVRPPFLDEAEGLDWAKRSVDFALDAGAQVCCLIPTRAGNGAMDELRRQGLFAPPRLVTLEAALEHGIGLGHGRIFADLWNLEECSDCPRCCQDRADRLRRMNLEQAIPARVTCPACEATCRG